MTQPGTTEVAVDMLVGNARRRYEDSYAYHALYQFVLDVAAIPRWAWSDLPWSDECGEMSRDGIPDRDHAP